MAYFGGICFATMRGGGGQNCVHELAQTLQTVECSASHTNNVLEVADFEMRRV